MEIRLVSRLVTAVLVCCPPLSAVAQTSWSWDGEAWADNRPFMSPITDTVKANLQSIMTVGTSNGRVAGRMGEFGDSITHSFAFFHTTILSGTADNETGHDYDPVRSWVAYSGSQPADENSFYRDHGKEVPYGNFSGWTVGDAVGAGHPFVAVEVGNGVTPGEYSWALIMFGTNDIDDPSWDAEIWAVDMTDFLAEFVDLGVIPVLSTIPPEFAHEGDGRVEAANQVIRALAQSFEVPYVDYYRLIRHHQPDTWHGTLISSDGTHPSAGGAGRDFSQDGLTTTDGYAARSKLAFDIAEKIRAIVFEDGDPEPLFADGLESGHTVAWTATVP